MNTIPGLLCVARYADWTRAIARCHALGVELVLYSREQVERVRALVAQRDPILLEAVLDVDRTLIRAWLERDCWERVRLTAENAALVEELRAWQTIG